MKNLGMCNPSSSSSGSAGGGLTISYRKLHKRDLFQVFEETLDQAKCNESAVCPAVLRHSGS